VYGARPMQDPPIILHVPRRLIEREPVHDLTR
jgi:hypothetical protein